MRPFAFPALVSVVWHLALVSVAVWAVADAAASSSGSTTTPSTKPQHPKQKQRLVLGVDGGTESIRACWFDADTGQVVGRPCAVPYTTHHPQPGWAEQDPLDWWSCLGQAVRESVASVQQELSKDLFEWCAMAIDTTCCSVVALDASYKPLRRCLLWMDQRSARQCKQILELCTSDNSPPEPALAVNCNGNGPISAEWMTPKALWLAQHEPDVWKAATTICEYQDYINYKLTGCMVASACNAASRWHWNGVECLQDAADSTTDNPHPGRPLSLYQRIGIPELAQKLPQTCLAMGSRIGSHGLTPEAAAHLNLPIGLPVIQGGPDAFVGMVGLGCIAPGQVCLITGSSHLHCVVTANATTAAGIWGAYRGAPLATTNFAEGGQSSTGSILKWAKDKLFHGGTGENNGDKQDSLLTYQILDDEASRIAPGADGLVALETFQGSRTPVTDALARGALLGLTLSHTRAHVWRALLEAVCFGTRACLDALLAVAVVDDTTTSSSADNHPKDFDSLTEIVMAGGVTRSELWLQMHADVTGKTIVIRDNSENAPLLGCAILASVGVGIYASVPDAVAAMVQTKRQVQPNMAVAARYNQIYHSVYRKVAAAVRPITHALHDLRGGGGAGGGSGGKSQDRTRRQVPWRGGNHESVTSTDPAAVARPNSNTQMAIVSPSLLACDWANMQSEVHRCLQAGLRRLHVDIFDGVFLDSPDAFTFGPQMVRAIRQSCESFPSKNKDDEGDGDDAAIVLDLHMCVDRPHRFVPTMAHAAGMGQDGYFIFQWEAVNDVKASFDLAQSVLEAGMSCGVSINPSTPVSTIYPLLEANLVRVVDILAVEPGFGGQSFQEIALHKLSELRQWRHDHGLVFDIMIDGGINADTATSALHAGADILVAGTFLFQHPKGLANGARVLLNTKKL